MRRYWIILLVLFILMAVEIVNNFIYFSTKEDCDYDEEFSQKTFLTGKGVCYNYTSIMLVNEEGIRNMDKSWC